MSEPKRYTVVDVAKQTITEVIDFHGCQNYPPRPLRLECDFCGTLADRLWCRPARPFCVWAGTRPRRIMDYDGGHWCACVFCNPLVEAQNLRALMARVGIINSAFAMAFATAKAEFIAYMEGVYAVVFAATDGPAIEWHSGDVWPLQS
jgi:hypothetical protein